MALLKFEHMHPPLKDMGGSCSSGTYCHFINTEMKKIHTPQVLSESVSRAPTLTNKGYAENSVNNKCPLYIIVRIHTLH